MRAIHFPRLGRRTAVAAAVSSLLLGGGVAYAAYADPCSALFKTSPNAAQAIAYERCRFDSIEAKLDALAKPPVTTTATQTVTQTVTVTGSPTTTTATTTATTPPASAWPDASNTGHSGTLTAYTGPCTIQTADLVLDSRDVACPLLLIQAPRVVIKNSKTRGIEVDYLKPTASITIQDSTVDVGQSSNSSVAGHDFTVLRSEVIGGQHSVGADGNVTVADSWLHDQWNDPNASFHNNAFITNGGSNMTVRHNTLHCTPQPNSNGGGCTADLSLFGDFAQVSNILVENNLFKANSTGIAYCAYGGHETSKPFPNSTSIRFQDNVFERGSNNKCGAFGAVTSFDSAAAGNVWSGNVWDDGTVLPSSG